MIKSEIHKKLHNIKVYVGKYSKEVQEKLFSLGYSWGGGVTDVSYTDKPFLFISTYGDFLLGYSDNLEFFNNQTARELSVNDILNIGEIYRPFKDEKELIREMTKHTPFGWIQDKYSKSLFCISYTSKNGVSVNGFILSFDNLLEYYTFLDGSVIGF